MKGLKRVFMVIAVMLLCAVLGLYITGNKHLLNGIPKTYLQGKTGPDIDDYPDFSNLDIEVGTPKEWPIADNYNHAVLSKSTEQVLVKNGSVAYLVIQDGALVFEKYWEDYNENSLSNSFSMAKSIVGICVGLAIEDGAIKSIDQKASEIITEFKDGPNEAVTIEQLLQMRSNINFDESYGNPFGFMAKAYYGTDLIDLTLGYEVEGTPGTKWDYLGGNTLLLAMIVERATKRSIHEYVQEKLWKPLGANNAALWSTDTEGGFEKAYCCFYSDARDFSRFGELYLRGGSWNGNQIISKEWVEATLTPVVLEDANHTVIDYYGYQWWLGSHKGMKFSMMRGILGQYVILIPEKNIIVTRLGHRRTRETQKNIPLDVYQYIDEALQICESK